jgi:hypothetical protein
VSSNAGADAQLGNSATLEAANNPSQCKDACDAQSACLGYWVSAGSAASWQCRLLGGEFRRGEHAGVNNALVAPVHTVMQHTMAAQCHSCECMPPLLCSNDIADVLSGLLL